MIQDEFWSPKFKVWREVTIPDCFAKFEKDGALANFDKIRDGAGGEHGGPPWYDGLTYEMIRGCADFLAAQPDSGTRSAARWLHRAHCRGRRQRPRRIPEHLHAIEGADAPLGSQRWQRQLAARRVQRRAADRGRRALLPRHRQDRLLSVATRLANHMCDVIGPPPRKNVIPGHSTGRRSAGQAVRTVPGTAADQGADPFPRLTSSGILALAEFFIEARGHWEGRTSFGAYGQDDRPVFDQQKSKGTPCARHSCVPAWPRLPAANQRAEYCQTARRLWDNLATRKTLHHRRIRCDRGRGSVCPGLRPSQHRLPGNVCRRRQRLLQPQHEPGVR